MNPTGMRYQAILKQAQRLPARSRRQLAETLLRPPNGDEQSVLVSVRRLRPETQARFLDLMDRHNAGQLNAVGRDELSALVARYEALMLQNTEALLKVSYPDLFTPSGRLRRQRLEQALRQKRRATKIFQDK